jgi:hypothetical protein
VTAGDIGLETAVGPGGPSGDTDPKMLGDMRTEFVMCALGFLMLRR